VPPAPLSASPGEPPTDKWPTILENARKKASEEATRDFYARYGLSPDFDPNAVRAHLAMLQSDPVTLYRTLEQQLQSRGMLNRPQESQAPTRPDPDLISEDGKKAYSAEAMERLLEWQQRQLLAQLQPVLAPLQQTQQELQQQHMRQTAFQAASDELAEARTWDSFDDLKPQILELMQADRRVTLWSAYNRLHQSLLKTRDQEIRQKTRQETLTELQQRPNPNTATPGTARPAVSSPRKGKGMSADVTDAVARAFATHAGAV
jgi:chromosome segregation ATPase